MNSKFSRLLAFSAFALIGCASEKPDDAAFSLFESKLEQYATRYKVPGMSAGVVNDGKLIWTKGFGYADIENKIKPDETTPYRLASVSKPVASVLMMQLMEKNLFSLDEPLDNYPNINEGFTGKNILLRHVLNHTSHDLGKSYRYNGFAFEQLTQVAEKITGKSYHLLLREKIIEKLNLKNTSTGQFVEDYEDVRNRLAKPYELTEEGEFKLSSYIKYNASTAGGLISSVRDLAKFDSALDEGKLISEKSMELMFTPTKSTDGSTLPYGLGWFVQDYNGQKIIWHYGYWNCSSTLYIKIPEQKLTFILLANSDALSSNFNLGNGDVTVSPFTRTFLDLAGKLQ